MSNFYRIIEPKKLIEFTIFKIYIKSIENFQKIIQDRGLDLNVVDLESNDNPNNYIIFASDQKEFKEQFGNVLKELNSTKMETLKNSAKLISVVLTYQINLNYDKKY